MTKTIKGKCGKCGQMKATPLDPEEQRLFDEKFIYDWFHDTGLKILGIREFNRPVSDKETKQFIAESNHRAVGRFVDRLKTAIAKNEQGILLTAGDDNFVTVDSFLELLKTLTQR